MNESLLRFLSGVEMCAQASFEIGDILGPIHAGKMTYDALWEETRTPWYTGPVVANSEGVYIVTPFQNVTILTP